ncbi:MAG: penicillin-binding transpeptidase domain-containing protein [Pirellulales bacterium]
MPRPLHDFDWHRLVDEHHDERPAAGTRHRLRWVLGIYAAALAIVLSRAVELELSDGENFRRLATRPLERAVTLEAPRGRILARDGTVLAADQKARALAVHFRYLESPPDPRWLRKMASLRLARSERRNSRRLAEAEETVRGQLADLDRRLAALCNVSDAEWRKRALRIQSRVTALADDVNRRRQQHDREHSSTLTGDGPKGVMNILAGLFAPPERLLPAEMVVAEQAAYHPIADDLPSDVAEAVEDHADAFPGVRIVEYARRTYPLGSLAANVVGHVGSRLRAGTTAVASESDDSSDAAVGRMGIERAWESKLRGQPGRAVQFTDRRGKQLSIQVERDPVPGRDVVLTLDPQLERAAEQLLDRFARRADRPSSGDRQPPHGGAIIVMDVRSGEILAAATEPRFDPGWFAAGDPRVEAVLGDPRRPLFDRATRMAISPGSVFKPLTALALLGRGVVDPQKPFMCQGYLDEPDSMRCQIFRRQGIGHGGVTLADALAHSCNVYFFHHATELGAAALADWAARFGFGEPSASDWPDQATGHLPDATELRAASRLEMFAIGQGVFTATPLQVVRMYAAIANGGYLVPARFTRDRAASQSAPSDPSSPSELPDEARIAGIDERALAVVREGLKRGVDDPAGTAFATVRLPSLAIAGKTGTAETGGSQEDHAWFAGYAPADSPRFAFVVVLEHGGSGATSAGTIARNLVQRMQQLGYFPAPQTKPSPPGKG